MKILFVCTGNTCRSAMAEWLLRKMLSDKNIDGIKVSSCGTGAMPYFKVPPVVICLMQEEGIDIKPHSARLVTTEILDNSDLVLCMEKSHKQYLNDRFPLSKKKTHVFKEYVKSSDNNLNIPDPIGLTDGVYLKTKEEIKENLIKLISILEAGR